MYNHMKTLNSLPDDENAVYMWDSQEIESTLESLGIPEQKEEITGIVAIEVDGDYLAVWLSESNKPCHLAAWYHPLPYYKPEKFSGFQNLPEYWNEKNKYYQD